MRFYTSEPDIDEDYDIPPPPPKNNIISISAIPNLIPWPNIETFSVVMRTSNAYEILAYIKHKFPQLRKLDLEMKLDCLDGHIRDALTESLQYFSKNNYCNTVCLSTSSDILTEVIESFWSAVSRHGSEYVKICYSISPKPFAIVDISKSNKTQDSIYTSLIYALLDEIVDTEWMHADFLQRNGTYIRKLQLDIKVDYHYDLPHNWGLPDDFMIDIFTYCPNLQYLHFHNCYIKTRAHTAVDSSKKLSLEELYITDCVLYPGTFEQLSMFVLETKRLRLGKIQYRTGQNADELHTNQSKEDHFNETRNAEIEVIMPFTKIDTIIFDDIRYLKAMYLRIYVLDEKVYYYYRLNRSTQTIENSREEKYLGVDNGKRMYIRCPNKPDLRMEYPLMQL